MSKVKNIKGSDLKAELSTDNLVIVDFWAEWCAPCKMVAPILDSLSKENPDTKIVKIDVDSNRETAVEYGVRSIPTLLFFKNGEAVASKVGTVSKTDIEKIIESLK